MRDGFRQESIVDPFKGKHGLKKLKNTNCDTSSQSSNSLCTRESNDIFCNKCPRKLNKDFFKALAAALTISGEVRSSIVSSHSLLKFITLSEIKSNQRENFTCTLTIYVDSKRPLVISCSLYCANAENI